MKRALAILVLFVALPGAAPATTLDVYFIDVEGGQATLIVTPEKETLLIDAGYGVRFGSRDPDRIMAAVRHAGIDRIDYLLVTHFHNDHVGGVPELATRIPIGTFIDYGMPLGTDRLTTTAFRNYEPVRANARHLVPQPGDRLPLKGIDVDVVSSGGAVLSKPLSGAGRPTDGCATAEVHPPDGTENYRSVGVLLRYGRFRFLDLGDLVGRALVDLVCPRNLVGEVSVYLVSHHGNYDTSLPALYHALRPQVVVVNNGPTKGGDAAALSTLGRQKGLDFWQLHASRNEGAVNADDMFLANVDDGQSGYWIKLVASKDGSFTVTNSRTGFSRKYSGR